jgi:uncharacterized protein
MSPKQKTVDSFPWHIWDRHEGTQRYHSAEGRAGRIISGRLLPGCDMLSGIIEMARSHGVASAWVNGFGSLAKANFSPGIRFNAATAGRVARIANIRLEGPIEIWSGMGRLGLPAEGEPVIHFHGLLVDEDGRLYGGHFFPEDNIVYATFEVHIQELLDVEFQLKQDEEVEIPLVKLK